MNVSSRFLLNCTPRGNIFLAKETTVVKYFHCSLFCHVCLFNSAWKERKESGRDQTSSCLWALSLKLRSFQRENNRVKSVLNCVHDISITLSTFLQARSLVCIIFSFTYLIASQHHQIKCFIQAGILFSNSIPDWNAQRGMIIVRTFFSSSFVSITMCAKVVSSTKWLSVSYFR